MQHPQPHIDGVHLSHYNPIFDKSKLMQDVP
jgi:hypothetical protein